jgi:hypothetical protein
MALYKLNVFIESALDAPSSRGSILRRFDLNGHLRLGHETINRGNLQVLGTNVMILKIFPPKRVGKQEVTIKQVSK